MHINDDEIQIMTDRLIMLSHCLNIRDMGFRYKDNARIPIDMNAIYEGTSMENEIDAFESVMKPIIGTGYIAGNDPDVLSEIGADIPHVSYEEEYVSGITVLFDNEVIKKINKYHISVEREINNAIDDMSYGLPCSDCDLDYVQIKLTEYGLYLIFPDDYIYMYSCVDEMIKLTRSMILKINEYEQSNGIINAEQGEKQWN